jgi:hypothetical protein
MKNEQINHDVGNTPNICPYRGCKYDPASAMDYPSRRNHCHVIKQLESPRLSHQRFIFLKTSHIDCPVLLIGSNHRLPKEFRLQTSVLQRNRPIMTITVAMSALIRLATLGLRLRNAWHPAPIVKNSPSQY